MGFVARTVLFDVKLSDAYFARAGGMPEAPEYLKNISRKIIIGEPLQIGTIEFRDFIATFPFGKRPFFSMSSNRASTKAMMKSRTVVCSTAAAILSR